MLLSSASQKILDTVKESRLQHLPFTNASFTGNVSKLKKLIFGVTRLKFDNRCHKIEIRQWQSIIDCLDVLLTRMKDNCVPSVLVQKIFTQLFSFINVQLFNSLLEHRECCTFHSGEFVKAGLAELELWCGNSHEYAGPSWEELKYVQQAVRLLVMQQKLEITYDDLATDLYPVLSSQQLYRICTLYYDDNSDTGTVSEEVISNLKTLASEGSNDADSDSFLLDDESST